MIARGVASTTVDRHEPPSCASNSTCDCPPDVPVTNRDVPAGRLAIARPSKPGGRSEIREVVLLPAIQETTRVLPPASCTSSATSGRVGDAARSIGITSAGRVSSLAACGDGVTVSSLADGGNAVLIADCPFAPNTSGLLEALTEGFARQP